MAKSNKNVSAIVSAMGVLMSIISELVALVREMGGEDADIYRLATPDGKTTMREIAKAIVQKKSPVLAPPAGGRIHTLEVEVGSLSWNDAVTSAGPNTGSDWDVRKIGGSYIAPTPGKRQVILVNFGKYMESEDVLAWGRANKLSPANPYLVFALGSAHPDLKGELGVPSMAAVSLDSCLFVGFRRAPFVWWIEDGAREASLGRFEFGWHDFYWFAFVCE